MNSEKTGIGGYDAAKHLMEEFLAQSPQRKSELEAKVKAKGIVRALPFHVYPPIAIDSVPTFDSAVTQKPTAMLKARFDVAGRIVRFSEEWLAVNDMSQAMQTASVRATHDSHRRNWADSAPMRYSDAQLTLFAYRPNVRGDLVYLAWPSHDKEPEVWVYTGMQSEVFEDFIAYMKWLLA